MAVQRHPACVIASMRRLPLFVGSWAFWVILVWDYFVFCTVAVQNHGAGSFCGLLSRICWIMGNLWQGVEEDTGISGCSSYYFLIFDLIGITGIDNLLLLGFGLSRLWNLIVLFIYLFIFLIFGVKYQFFFPLLGFYYAD